MTKATTSIDLRDLVLKAGGGARLDLLVQAEDFVFGDQRYVPADSPISVVADVSRTATGYVVRVRFSTAVQGPCMRCFDERPFAVEVDQNEVHEPGLELASEYVSDDVFDLAGFVHDAIGLTLPQTMSGRIDDSGACELCGRGADELRKLGIGDDEPEPGGDPRWAKLRELQ